MRSWICQCENHLTEGPCITDLLMSFAKSALNFPVNLPEPVSNILRRAEVEISEKQIFTGQAESLNSQLGTIDQQTDSHTDVDPLGYSGWGSWYLML